MLDTVSNEVNILIECPSQCLQHIVLVYVVQIVLHQRCEVTYALPGGGVNDQKACYATISANGFSAHQTDFCCLGLGFGLFGPQVINNGAAVVRATFAPPFVPGGKTCFTARCCRG